jgi:hypothetical protein
MIFVYVSARRDFQYQCISGLSWVYQIKHQFLLYFLHSGRTLLFAEAVRYIYQGGCSRLISIASSDFLFDDINNARFSDSAEIAKLVTLAVDDLAHNPAHDLCNCTAVSADVLQRKTSAHTFPDLVLGRSLTIKIFFGAANGPITFLT